MELKDLKQLMHEKGYTTHYNTASGNMACMSKYVEDKDIWIHADIYKDKDMVTLSCNLNGLFTIKTSAFVITHPRFKTLFEDRLISMAYKAKHSTL